MTTTQTAGSLERGFQSLLSIDIEPHVFCANWANCDQFSSYFARMISHTRSDAFFYSNLYSSVLNNILETVFHIHADKGKLRLRAKRKGAVERFEILIPCNSEVREFYLKTAEDIRTPEVSEIYFDALFSNPLRDRRIGLLELAVDYGAMIFVEQDGDDEIKLAVNFVLEEQTS